MGRIGNVLAATVLAIVAGCDQTGTNVDYADGQEPLPCGVDLYVPSYEDYFYQWPLEVYWDGHKVYSGRTPRDTMQATGMPMILTNIRTSPGTHVLTVRSGKASKTVDIKLEKAGYHNYKISRTDDGKEMLVVRLPDWLL